jgi:hypothetical protein
MSTEDKSTITINNVTLDYVRGLPARRVSRVLQMQSESNPKFVDLLEETILSRLDDASKEVFTLMLDADTPAVTVQDLATAFTTMMEDDAERPLVPSTP